MVPSFDKQYYEDGVFINQQVNEKVTSQDPKIQNASNIHGSVKTNPGYSALSAPNLEDTVIVSNKSQNNTTPYVSEIEEDLDTQLHLSSEDEDELENILITRKLI